MAMNKNQKASHSIFRYLKMLSINYSLQNHLLADFAKFKFYCRQEQERRRQLELEKQLAKQRELEQEKEEQRRKALEQREVINF